MAIKRGKHETKPRPGTVVTVPLDYPYVPVHVDGEFSHWEDASEWDVIGQLRAQREEEGMTEPHRQKAVWPKGDTEPSTYPLIQVEGHWVLSDEWEIADELWTPRQPTPEPIRQQGTLERGLRQTAIFVGLMLLALVLFSGLTFGLAILAGLIGSL
ncbi:MAG: hypothetical protein WDZ96_00175 [Acidimicrobiia bacterium]